MNIKGNISSLAESSKGLLYYLACQLESIAEKIGLKGEVINESWFDKMKSKAINNGLRSFFLNLFFEKTEELHYKDYFYLAVRLYGFVFAFNMLKNGLKIVYDRIVFSSKMRKIRNRKIREMYYSNKIILFSLDFLLTQNKELGLLLLVVHLELALRLQGF